MTRGERAFEQFCQANALDFERVEEGQEKQPDYILRMPSQVIVVEVKDFDLNEEEKAAVALLAKGGTPVWGGAPGDRVRSKIDRARRQLRKRSAGQHPSILVLHDPRPFPFNNVDGYDVKAAMYGFETYGFSVPVSPTSKLRMTGRAFGSGSKFRLDRNAYVSAISILTDLGGSHGLSVYHNFYATIPVKPGSFANVQTVRQFVISSQPFHEFGEWEELERETR